MPFRSATSGCNCAPENPVLAPRGVPHTFSSVGTAPSRMLIAFTPAVKMEQYFRDAEKSPAHAFDADFMSRYEMELVGPSPFWKPKTS